MDRIFITLLALSDFRTLKIESTHDISELIHDLLCSFANSINDEERVIQIEKLQQNSSSLRTKINSFVSKHSRELPQINQLNDFLKKIKENEFFFFLPNELLDVKTDSHYYIKLISLADNIDFEIYNRKFSDTFLQVYQNYEVILYNELSKKRIGEIDKQKRICRFCNKTEPSVTFLNDAHAISESLGNKKIYLNEECDCCNSRFSNGIEYDIIEFLGIWRTIFKIKGKKSIPQTDGTNFSMTHEESVLIKIHDEIINNKPESFEINLKSKELSQQNVYRALSKFAISVIDKSYLSLFEPTINWINQESAVEKLPLIAIRRTEYIKKHPEIIVYLKEKERKDLPFAVVEFQFTFLKFVYILPLCERDSLDFSTEENYKNFWNFFNLYNIYDDWNFIDFSNNERKVFEFRLKMK